MVGLHCNGYGWSCSSGDSVCSGCSGGGPAETLGWSLSLGCVVGSVADGASAADAVAPQVKLARQADGSYQARLNGDFTLTVAGDDPLRLRLLLSLYGPQVLTGELCARIVSVCATFPHWEVARVHQRLRQQGVAVTAAQVQQAATQSGWQQLQQTLFAHYALGEACLHLRDPWLVAQLLAQITTLLAQLENGQPPAQRVMWWRHWLWVVAGMSPCISPPCGTVSPVSASCRCIIVPVLPRWHRFSNGVK